MGVRQIIAPALVGAAFAASAGAATPTPTPTGPIALAAPRSFAAAVAAIERATGARGEPLETGRGTIPLGEGRSFAVPSKLAERLLVGNHATFREAGFYLFRYERSFGLAGEKDRLGLLAVRDRNAVLRRMGTSGADVGIGTERIVAWLDDLAKEEPFELTEIGADYVAGRFARSPKDPAAIARRSAELAPELVAGRESTLDLLTEEIRVNRTLYLIW